MSNQYNKVLNPKTNRYININGKIYNSLKDLYFNDINYSIIVKHIDILYSICNVGRILIFTEFLNEYNKSKDIFLLFIKNINQKEENISIEYFKLISDSKKTLKQLIDDFINENNTTNYFSIGMQFISIFVSTS